MVTTLFPYQEKVVEAMRHMPNVALFPPTGTGKTVMSLFDLSNQFKAGKITQALVISKKRVSENWYYEEIPAHQSALCPIQTYCWNSKKPFTINNEGVMWQKGAPLRPPSDHLLIICMNKEALLTNSGKAFLDKFFQQPTAFIIDESHAAIKNYTAKTSRSARAYGRAATLRRILTATPMPNSPEDMFGQYNFLSPEILRTNSLTAFRRQFCNQVQRNFGGRLINQTTGFRNQELFERMVAPVTIKLNKEEVLPDLPPKNYIKKQFNMEGEQAKLYRQMKEQFFLEMQQLEKSGEPLQTTAPLAIQRITRLAQITSGHVVSDTGEITRIPCAKLEALMEILEDREQEKTIIWCRFIEDIRRIQDEITRKLGEGKAVAVHGKIDADSQQGNLDTFRRTSVPFLICNEVAAEGLTLTVADTAIYYSNTFNFAKRFQSEDRIHRISQTKVTFFTDLLTHDTVDERVYNVLKQKGSVHETLFTKGYSEWFM